jgi:hypothetical protein
MADLSLYRSMPGMGAYLEKNIETRRKRQDEDEVARLRREQAELQKGLFQRGEKEFDLKRQAAEQQQRIGDLKIMAAQQALTAPQEQKMPFAGTGFDQQVANEVYKFNLQRGMTPDQATQNAIDTVMMSKQRMTADPVTGSPVLVPGAAVFNREQPQRREPIQAPPADPLRAANEMFGLMSAEQPLYGRLSEATGAVSGLQKGIGQVLGQAGIRYGADYTAASQALATEANSLVKALQQNPRYAEGERKQVREDVGILPSLLNSPEQARVKLEELDRTLRRYLSDEIQISRNESMPKERRQQAMMTSVDIARFLNAAGVPQRGGASNIEQILQELGVD